MWSFLYIGSIFYLLSSLLNLILPLEGLLRLYRSKDAHILRGGFVFYTTLNLASWLIYGFISKTLLYSNPIFFGLTAFYLLVSLVLFHEYANIVYHNVIIINYSWWVRQQKADLIYKMSVFTAGLQLLVPHFVTLYYMVRRKDRFYFSFFQFWGHLISALFYLVFCVSQGAWVLIILIIGKFGILLLQLAVYKKLEKIAKDEELIKKKH